MNKVVNIALAGNPNSGKSSLFNALTGLNQKVGNFPGVTVDKKLGYTQLSDATRAQVIDLPGTYSLYPRSADEYVAYETLLNPTASEKPDVVVVVADASNLKRNLLFCSQIMDLKIPVILVLTMMDIARKKGTNIDIEGISIELGIPVISINPRKSKGISSLKKAIQNIISDRFHPPQDFVPLPETPANFLKQVKKLSGIETDYAALHIAFASEKLSFLSEDITNEISELKEAAGFSKAKYQADEIMRRYDRIDKVIKNTVAQENPLKKQLFTDSVDKILLHKFWGNLILFIVLLLLFQSIFWLASYPMDWIDAGFAQLSAWLGGVLPETWWSDLLINGLLAGIGGIVIFVPQIAILFGLITLLEDSGYMARISFLSDRTMRSVGLNGRAAMPLISGMACAIPAVMAARIIEDRKERLITILVTPLMSCSARLPVYTILISLVIPQKFYFGFISLQGLMLMALYLLGFFSALIVAKVLNMVMKQKNRSIFLMELPLYRAPRWKNALNVMYEKSKIFVKDAGKVIIVISLILWALASYGPSYKMNPVKSKYEGRELSEQEEVDFAHEKLENSYAGIIGKTVEPIILPLGYDWKIGIALISSFAAREAFVGTMATLYSVGDAADDDTTLKEKMREARRADGTVVYTFATGFSLLIFYVFAMQCMSTLAVVKRETKSWKWPTVQLVYMSALAYICALVVYQIFK